MTDSESPRTISELLYTHCPKAPARFQFDNGCNVHRYVVHEKPSLFKHTQLLMDQLHFAGNTSCYCTLGARGSRARFFLDASQKWVTALLQHETRAIPQASWGS